MSTFKFRGQQAHYKKPSVISGSGYSPRGGGGFLIGLILFVLGLVAVGGSLFIAFHPHN